jgi:hypothetical protein
MSLNPPVIIEPGTNYPGGGGGASSTWMHSNAKTLPHKKGGLIKKTAKASKPAKKTVKKAVKKAVKKPKKS